MFYMYFERHRWPCLVKLNGKMWQAWIIVPVFMSELPDSYLSKCKLYRRKHRLEPFFAVVNDKNSKIYQKRFVFVFQYKKLKYYRLNIKGRKKMCRKNKSIERFNGLFTQGHMVGQHQRKQHESTMCKQLYIYFSASQTSRMHLKILMQRLWS